MRHNDDEPRTAKGKCKRWVREEDRSEYDQQQRRVRKSGNAQVDGVLASAVEQESTHQIHSTRVHHPCEESPYEQLHQCERVQEIEERRSQAEGNEYLGDRDEDRGITRCTVVEVHPHERVALEFDCLEEAAEDDAQKDHPFDQCARGYNPTPTKSLSGVSHGLCATHKGSIDIEGLQLAEGNPTRFDYLVYRSDVVASGMEPDAEIDV